MKARELLNYVNKHKTIYCYGAGKYGRFIRAFLQENGIDLTAFVVTDDHQYDKVLDVPVISVSNIEFKIHDGIIIGVSKRYRDQLLVELNHRNIDDCFIVYEHMISEIESELTYRSWNKFCNPIWVLYYHRVNYLKSDIWKLSITPERFEEHIRYLVNNYDLISITDITKGVTEPSVAVTFDDGYADNLYYALPILEKYNVPATIFVSTGNIDTKKEFWWDTLEHIICNSTILPDAIEWKGKKYITNSVESKLNTCFEMHPILKGMTHVERENELKWMAEKYDVKSVRYDENRILSKEELRELSKSKYINIGAHTITHSCLKNESEHEQVNEIVESKKKLEEIIGKRVTCFSFPFGGENDFSYKTISILKNSGIDMAFTTKSGLADKASDNFTIPRNWVQNDMTVGNLERMMMKLVLLSE
ncbi:polysaccharide deacetylase family protein [Butyrivibrio sp. WCE2006]|uniref:polysaccharide deacetylase family protein n=1 Tax=Butyrivibrio sp. WCE2006 TaxID=1410611 RepID=UPI0005D29E42|nr:polysaccharide deacetylase family protein [Butyrivibrio sp. WCE2006]